MQKKFFFDGFPIGSMDPPMTPPPQMDSSALADQVSLLTREVERLRSEMAGELSRSRRRRRSSTPRRRRRSSTPRRRRRSSSRSRARAEASDAQGAVRGATLGGQMSVTL